MGIIDCDRWIEDFLKDRKPSRDWVDYAQAILAIIAFIILILKTLRVLD